MRNDINKENIQYKNSPLIYSFEAILEMARHIDNLNNKIEELNTKLDFESNIANISKSELYRLVGKLVECGSAKIETVNIEIEKK